MQNSEFTGRLIPINADLRPQDESKPSEDSDPRDHAQRQMEFVSLGLGCRKARRLPTLS